MALLRKALVSRSVGAGEEGRMEGGFGMGDLPGRVEGECRCRGRGYP